MRPVNTIVIHCSDTPEGRPVSVETIRRWHLDRGWRDIGYHYVIDLDGNVHEGRPIGQIGAHVRGHNTGTIGICYVGGVTNDGRLAPKDTRTPAQVEALRSLVAELAETYPGIMTVKGHRDFPRVAKACPCFDAQPELQPVVAAVRAGRLAPRSRPEPADPIEPAFPPDPEPNAGKSLLQSKTNLSAIGAFVTSVVTALTSLETWVAALVIVIAAGFAFWIIRERMQKARELGV